MADRSDADEGPSIPIEAIPDPLVSFDIQDGEPVLHRANTAFTRVFGELSNSPALREVLGDATAAESDAIEELCRLVAHGESLETTSTFQAGRDGTAGRRYRLRRLAVSPSAAGSGWLLFTPTDHDSTWQLGSDRIASVLSHDLRNPLDVANAHLGAARRTGEDEHFAEVDRSLERMERIIGDVLTLARGTAAIEPSPDVDLAGVAEDARSTVDTTGATIRIDDPLPRLSADADRLQRLFENLYRNSLEHARNTETGDLVGEEEPSHEQSTAVTIRVGGTDRGFYVEDDGAGIASEDRDRVFEPGYSAGPGSGTGLGLTIVERIAEAHGWEVTLEDSADGGARFEFHVDGERA